MKKMLLTLLICGSVWSVKSQIVTPDLIASGSSATSNTNTSLDWSIGELSVTTIGQGNIQITQGFHQTYPETTNLSTVFEDGDVINLYPNPSSGKLNLELSSKLDSSIKLELYTLLGQLVLQSNFNVIEGMNIYSLGIDFLPEGVYSLKITNIDTRSIQNYKIIKVN